ncbi:hypothetical protein KR018_000942 [Drosophila ironensis]|nr:hypothetical protein KR018_000942 [Drosophila ironensis]
MAKLAVVFLFFALFAIAMAAKVPRQQAPAAAPSENPVLDDIQKFVDGIVGKVREGTTPEKLAEAKATIVNFGEESLKVFQEAIAKINAGVQELKPLQVK